ncbi:hypothetical protein FNV43_RR14592 [Rhamnella rubrinervis]|uniref:Uncharacterized protein n=1 Tax=Rhamnella rubrinervis TaxID=2594499 RepID=A0A8K0H3F8_9ROSA|nr:hypothetical protein FNV43_RR14592 [Rhamnella rubrinervis]
MASEQRQNIPAMGVMPARREDESTPRDGITAGSSGVNNGVAVMDTRVEQLMSQMEELVRSARVQQQRNGVQEQINRQLLDAFNVVQTPTAVAKVDQPHETRRDATTDRGKNPAEMMEETDQSSQSNKRSRGKNGCRSRGISRGYQSSDDSRSTDGQTAKRGRAVRGRNPSRYRGTYRAARPELIDLVRQEGRTNDWYDEVQDTPFVDEITAVNTPAGFSTPKFSLYDGIADPRDHIIHFKQAMVPTSIPWSIDAQYVRCSPSKGPLARFSRLPSRSMGHSKLARIHDPIAKSTI